MKKIKLGIAVLLLGTLLTVTVIHKPQIEAVLHKTSSGSGQLSEKIIKKYKKLCDQNDGLTVISKENVDDVWKNDMPDLVISNLWMHSEGNQDFDVVAFGALKQNPGQGAADVLSIHDGKLSSPEQILAPDSNGGSLSVLNMHSAKDYDMEVQDENNVVYLFNYYNGFTAYKNGTNGDWSYWNS